MLAVGERGVDLRQLLQAALLVVFQLLQVLLAFGDLLLGLLAGAALCCQLLVQAGQVVLGGKGLAQARGVLAVLGLAIGKRLTRGVQRLFELAGAHLQLGLLLLLLGDLRCQRCQLRGQCLLAVELVTLRGQALQAHKVQALLSQLLPALLGGLQRGAGFGVLGLQLALLVQPVALLFQLALAGLVGLELLLRLFQALVELGAGFGGHRQQVAGTVLQGIVGLAGFACLAEGPLAQAGVDGGVGELFQQLAAFFVVGLEEGAEFALGQHHRAGELFEVQAQAGFDQLFVFVLAAAQYLLAVQVVEALAAVLQLAVGLVAGAVGFPAGAVAAAIDADEIDFGKAAAGAAAQQVARVGGRDLAVCIRHLGLAANVVQPWHGAEQRQAQGVEQGTFARPGRPGDGEQAGAGQRFGGEIDIDRAGQGCQVLQADGKNLHGCSSSCCTSCNSRAKSASACSSAGLP
ncbi:hypothetical protein D3C81_734960 [compost metagenome]